jgi:hypothetical protein
MVNKPWLKKKNNEKVIDVMGAKVTVKKLTFGESRKAIQGAIKFNPVTKQNEIDQTLASVLRSVAMIKDWELTDENDEKLPIDFNTIESLDEEFVGELIKKLNAEDDNEVTAEEKKQ